MRQIVLFAAAMATATFAGSCGSDPSMSERDAIAYTEAVLNDIGLEDVSVVDEVRAGVHGPDRAPVWRTRSTVDGGTVELAIERDGTYVRFVRDVAADGGPLLTDEQFDELEDFSLNPAAERRADQRRGPGLLAAGVLVTVVAGLATGVFTGHLDLAGAVGRGEELAGD